MRKVIVAATDSEGRFVALSNVSEAVADSGVAREQLLGREMWLLHGPEEAAAIRATLAKCLATGDDQHMFLTSQAGGREEAWSVQFVACHKPATAFVLCRLLETPKGGMSREDRDLLKALANDSTTDDFARDHNLERDAVYMRLRRLRMRFHVKSTPGLIGAVMRLGLI